MQRGKQWSRWRVGWIVCAATMSCAAGTFADVAPELVGVWQRQTTDNTQAPLYTDISADGSFKVWVGNETATRDSGQISTTHDSPPKYHIDFASGPKDDGTYQVKNNTELSFTDSKGSSHYKRTAAYLPAPPAKTPLMLKTDFPQPRDLLTHRSTVSQRLWPQLASTERLLCPQIEKAAELVDSQKPNQASTLIQQAAPEWQRDIPFLDLAGSIRLASGDPLQARVDFDRVLLERPDLVEAYLGRALSAGRLGSVPRMLADLAFARSLDPSRTEAFLTAHRPEIDAIQSAQPRQTAQQLADQLIKAALGGAQAPALLPTAVDLVRAEYAMRVFPQERFQDGVRLRSAVINANPNDPQAWAELATYLYLEGPEKFGRGHTDGIEWINDRLLAMRFANQALTLDNRNLTAMATKAWLLEQDNQEKDSLDLANRGLALVPGYPRFAKLQSILLSVSSIRASNAAQQQRAPKTSIITTPDWIIVSSRGPTQQELEAAKQFDTMSAANAAQGNQSEFQAWQRYQGSLEEMNVAASYYDYIGQSDKALALWKQILTIDPKDETALISLEDYYKQHHQVDDEFEARFRLENVFSTTAATLSERAQNELTAHDLDRANVDLTRALATDPADMQIYLLLGQLAVEKKSSEGWWPYARCAEAIAAAIDELRGVDLSPDATAAISPDQAQLILAVWNDELRVAGQDGHDDVASQFHRRIDALQHRIVAPPAPPARSDLAANQEAAFHFTEHIRVLIENNEMDAAAKCILSGASGSGTWHAESDRATADLEYPIYLYLRPRLYHFQLWHYFGPSTLQNYEQGPPSNGANNNFAR
jgi:tetratricopeptide (TPR) repeat protein